VPPDAAHHAATILLSLYVPLALGYALRKLGVIGMGWTRPCMVWLMVLIEPPIAMYSLWALRTEDVAAGGGFLLGILSVMFAAAVIAVALIFIGRLVAEAFGHRPGTRGAFILSAALSNNGFTFGVFICLVFLGLRGQSVGLTYAAYFMPFLVTVGFAIARHYGRAKKLSFRRQVLGIFTEPLSALPLAGFAIGILLHTVAEAPPDWILPINRVAVRAEAGIYAFAIGCTLSFSSVRKYWRECGACCAMKFLVAPVLGLGIVYILSSAGVLSGEPIVRRVFLIQTCTPAAIMSVVIAKIFRLDEGLASSCWVVTTVASAAVLPVLYLLVT